MLFSKSTILVATLVVALASAKLTKPNVRGQQRELRMMGSKSSSTKSGSKSKSKSKSKSSTSTICFCEEPEYEVNTMIAPFWQHIVMAEAQDCQLATFSTVAEQMEIMAALAATPLSAAMNTDMQPLAWLGFARPQVCPTGDGVTPPNTLQCTTGSLAEGWAWLDGCTPFNTAFWGRMAGGGPLEPNDGAPGGEYLGGIWYQPVGGGNAPSQPVGSLGDIPPYYSLPAVYECCPDASTGKSKNGRGGKSKSKSRR